MPIILRTFDSTDTWSAVDERGKEGVRTFLARTRLRGTAVETSRCWGRERGRNGPTRTDGRTHGAGVRKLGEEQTKNNAASQGFIRGSFPRRRCRCTGAVRRRRTQCTLLIQTGNTCSSTVHTVARRGKTGVIWRILKRLKHMPNDERITSALKIRARPRQLWLRPHPFLL